MQIIHMMTSTNGNFFRVTGPLCFTGHPWIPHTRARDAELWWTNGWVNNRDASDLRHHRAHYDVIVMLVTCCQRIECLSFPILTKHVYDWYILMLFISWKRDTRWSTDIKPYHLWIHKHFITAITGYGCIYYRLFYRNWCNKSEVKSL